MLHLTEDEIYERTGWKHREKQYAELARQGISFTRRHDGFPLILRSEFDKPVVAKKKEPNFKALMKAG